MRREKAAALGAVFYQEYEYEEDWVHHCVIWHNKTGIGFSDEEAMDDAGVPKLLRRTVMEGYCATCDEWYPLDEWELSEVIVGDEHWEECYRCPECDECFWWLEER